MVVESFDSFPHPSKKTSAKSDTSDISPQRRNKVKKKGRKRQGGEKEIRIKKNRILDWHFFTSNHYLKLLNRSSSKVVGGGVRSGSVGGGVIGLCDIIFCDDTDACPNAASIETGAEFLSFHLHQLLFVFLPGTDITEPVGDIGGGLVSLSYVEFKLTLERNLRILPGLVDEGDVGERGGVVASVAVTEAAVSMSTS